jgi:hypothetical protein
MKGRGRKSCTGSDDPKSQESVVSHTSFTQTTSKYDSREAVEIERTCCNALLPLPHTKQEMRILDKRFARQRDGYKVPDNWTVRLNVDDMYGQGECGDEWISYHYYVYDANHRLWCVCDSSTLKREGMDLHSPAKHLQQDPTRYIIKGDARFDTRTARL